MRKGEKIVFGIEQEAGKRNFVLFFNKIAQKRVVLTGLFFYSSGIDTGTERVYNTKQLHMRRGIGTLDAE